MPEKRWPVEFGLDWTSVIYILAGCFIGVMFLYLLAVVSGVNRD